MFITNLGKCTQIDARSIQYSVYDGRFNIDKLKKIYCG